MNPISANPNPEYDAGIEGVGPLYTRADQPTSQANAVTSPAERLHPAQLKPNQVLVVCARCHGYGVTVYPDGVEQPRQKTRCGDCGGNGHMIAELWEQWRPSSTVSALLAGYERVAPKPDQG